MSDETKNAIMACYAVAFAVIGIGAVCGAIYYVCNFFGNGDVKNYLDAYTNSLRNGIDGKNVINTALKSYSILFFGLVISAFFKLGFLVSIFLLLRKGFVTAFSVSAMVDVYGASGLALSGVSFFCTIVFIPIVALLAAVSVFFMKKRKKFDKRDKFIYIIFLMIIFTIFCGCAFLEGGLTTTFMKWLAFKIT